MSPWKIIVAREDWLSMYVDDPLRTEIIATDDFNLARKTYDEQKEIPNSNGLHYEINISIYFKDSEIAYISDNGKFFDYSEGHDIPLEEIKKLSWWLVNEQFNTE